MSPPTGSAGPSGAQAPAGLQRERTVLAWDRTALALTLVGLLLVRTAGPPYLRPAHVAGLLVTALGPGVLLHARRRHRELMVEDVQVVPAVAGARLLAGGVLLGGVSALVLLALDLVLG